MKHLTEAQRARLIQILEDEGCQCEGEHYEPEDATSLNCLAGNALHDLIEMEKAHPVDRDGNYHGPHGNNPRHPLDMD